MNRKISICALVLTLALLLCGIGCTQQKNPETSGEPSATSGSGGTSATSGSPLSDIPQSEDGLYAVIQVKEFGRILVKLDPEVAPITVANFKKLVREGFYEGIIFHRIVPGFVIQGGDPTGTGYYGSEENIKGEFAANGVDNPLSHTRGVISMARAGNDYNSASSQFFIVLSDNYTRSLDGQYAGFGKVVAGMEVVDAIAAVPCQNSKPVSDVVIEKVILCDEAAANAAFGKG